MLNVCLFFFQLPHFYRSSMFASIFFISWAEFGVVRSILTNYPASSGMDQLLLALNENTSLFLLRNQVISLGRHKFEQWTINNWRNEINKRGINITTVDKESAESTLHSTQTHSTTITYILKLDRKIAVEKKDGKKGNCRLVYFDVWVGRIVVGRIFVRLFALSFSLKATETFIMPENQNITWWIQGKGKEKLMWYKKWNDKVRWCEYTQQPTFQPASQR